MGFEKPVVATEVVVYIASDGRTEHDPAPKNITVNLVTTNNESVELSSTTLDCARPVTSIPITHDLSQPFFHTKGILDWLWALSGSPRHDCSSVSTFLLFSFTLSNVWTLHVILLFSPGVRLGFRSYNISISAIKLRSTKLLDPLRLASCGPHEVYNPRSGHCVVQKCSTRCTYYMLDHAQPQCTGVMEGDTCTIRCKKG